jgi:hypothetical protein
MDDAEQVANPTAEQRPPRPAVVRIGAAVAALALAVAVPVLFILGAVAPKRFQPLIGTLLVVSIGLPIALWFLMRSNRARESDDGDGAKGRGGQ